MKSIRNDLINDLWHVGQSIGLGERERASGELFADLSLGSVIAAEVLQCRVMDAQFVAADLAAFTGSTSMKNLDRCMGEKE